MTIACLQCAEPLLSGALFCGQCGVAQPARKDAAPCLFALSIDDATIRHFEVGTRCMLRLRVENLGAHPFASLALHCEARGAGSLLSASAASLLPGQSTVIPLFVVPTVAGYEELTGTLLAVDLSGQASSYLFERVQFRIGSGQSAPHVQVVNIDQSGARVIDNSRSQLGAGSAPAGGLISETEGEWRPIKLSLVAPPSEAREASKAREAPAPAPVTAAPVHVDFEVKTERGIYHLTSVVARGDLATVYGGARRGASRDEVAVKLADDSQDNDLLQAEVRALALLTAARSRQQKHLPVVLDQVRTADGRLGTVFERVDGMDLCTIRERLPGGIPERHLIWIMRRVLSVLGWAHHNGILHGNVEPAHILVRPRDHNVWLVDWCWSIVEPAKTGQTYRCINEDYSPPEARERKAPLPSGDLYSLGKTMIYAAGGDPAAKTLPDTVDPRLQRFLKFFAYESALGRPQDAWDMYKQIDNLREEVFGPHKFLEFVV